MTDKPRLVFDTNVLVSAAIFRESTPGLALTAALHQGVILLSQATAQELRSVLARRKFDRYISPETRNRFLAALLRNATFLEPAETIQACRDPKDDKFLEIAEAGQAMYLITGDEDLLVLNPFRGTHIVTASEFVAIDLRKPL
jgi:uncharacterized protein